MYLYIFQIKLITDKSVFVEIKLTVEMSSLTKER